MGMSLCVSFGGVYICQCLSQIVYESIVKWCFSERLAQHALTHYTLTHCKNPQGAQLRSKCQSTITSLHPSWVDIMGGQQIIEVDFLRQFKPTHFKAYRISIYTYRVINFFNNLKNPYFQVSFRSFLFQLELFSISMIFLELDFEGSIDLYLVFPLTYVLTFFLLGKVLMQKMVIYMPLVDINHHLLEIFYLLHIYIM